MFCFIFITAERQNVAMDVCVSTKGESVRIQVGLMFENYLVSSSSVFLFLRYPVAWHVLVNSHLSRGAELTSVWKFELPVREYSGV